MAEHLLEVRGIAKSFPGVRALDGVSFTLERGEIRTLAGENGAGKSTLLNILGGALRPDRGSITIDGVRRMEYTSRQALAEGVRIAHQEPAIVPQLTVTQNLLLGRTRTQRASAQDDLDQALQDVHRMGFPMDGRTPVGRLSPAQRHALTIARAFAFGAKIVALDEPTTSMLEHNVEGVLTRVREIAHGRGVGVIYVSHKMPEVMSVSDTVVVLRDGRPAYDAPIAETSSEDIVRRMVGRELLSFERRHPVAADAEVHFEASGVTHPSGVGPESIQVRRGEVVGIAGLVGSGRTEFLRALIRADEGSEGTVRLAGRTLKVRSPRDSRDAGIAFIPEDRKHQGLVLQTPAYANVALTSDRQLNGFGPFISTKRQIATAEEMGRRMSLRPADVRLNARQFSGGNQQKIVIAKWIWLGASVFLFDEPTKGVDVGGKVEIYELIDQLASEGHAVIVVSSDLPEIISLSDRVLVMRAGRFVSEHVGDDITEHSIVTNAMGVAKGIS
ncbi:sugar ABC transporter ATP-binding protein [Rathayibacter sp. VKM Ac-2929]|uniref:sugar ABC transporter ATP-binding protein n=1 Tax=Rathayibacter sp. VKM Ac-2929 TaxID=2929480 RepID=UPI001FB3FC29|nr:sugar ABC transporter ATP-binding protein [Rathayibacter sp. VKM Ac-2929]MCJ1671658.1 sugar ABC transporter ATP-binding protein [Rathayibacter sp. VKM Ac-2929]